MKLPIWLIPDICLAAVILLFLANGYRKGIILMCGKIGAMICAIFTASYARTAYSDSLAQKYIVPFVARLLDEAKDRLGINDAWANLGSVLNEASLPEFLKTDILEKALNAAAEKGNTALETASALIAQRLSEWILVVAVALLTYKLVLMIIRKIISPLIKSVPIIGGINNVLGAVLGCAFGIFLAGFFLWFAYSVLPVLSQGADSMLSSESIEKSFFVKAYFQYFPNVFDF